jgi:Na+/H+ antiporter NhaC
MDSITLLPYFFLLISTYLGNDLIANLTISSLIGVIIEILYHKIMFLDAITTMFNGFCEESIISNILLFHIIIAGMIKIILYNDGFNYITNLMKSKKIQKDLTIELLIILITIIINVLVIIDTIAFNITIDSIKVADNENKIPKDKVALLINITKTIIQIVIPYSLIMLLATQINHNSYVEMMKYMIYPILITSFAIIWIFISNTNFKIRIT